MATTPSVPKHVIPLNCTHVERWETVEETAERLGEECARDVVHVHCGPSGRHQRLCPRCGRRCPRDGLKGEGSWRAPDLNGVPVVMRCRPQRIKCPEHGEPDERIPWADGASRFTGDLDDEVAWLACQTGRSAIATYPGINWRTVGNCVRAAHGRLEPDVGQRLHCGLRRICVDEL